MQWRRCGPSGRAAGKRRRRSDETHLSTLEPRPQAPPRVSGADGDQGGAQDPQRAPRAGPQVAERISARRIRTAMTPSTAPDARTGKVLSGAYCRARGSLCVLRKRASFLAAARARRESVPGMMVQGRDRSDGDPAIRVGFTCSKKVGNAVARNRAKRRLREVARMVLPGQGKPG